MSKLQKAWQRVKPDLFSGLATGVFSIPEGMAYAKIAGVNPIYGLYSGMIATIAASLTTGTTLMISTITSAIAISTRSVLELAGLADHNVSAALFTLTFLVAVVMLVLGLLRLGKIVHFVSNAVLTGFVVGACVLIVIGQLHDLVGISRFDANRLERAVYWLIRLPEWELYTSLIGFGSLISMLILQRFSKLDKFSSIIVLVIGTLLVYFLDWNSVALVGSIAKVGGGLPGLSFPDFTLAPKLAVGAVSVALVALVQGAGVSMALHKNSSLSRDFIGQGVGNLAGSFFQSMGTGGSLSRTGISVESGAKSRLGGVFAGLWLILIVFFLGKWIEYIPLSSIAGILCVIAANIIKNRATDIRLILKTSRASTAVMLATFISALFIPLQWTIFIGAALSFLFYLYTSATDIKLFQWKKGKSGYFEKHQVAQLLDSHELMVLDYEGNGFFAELPQLEGHLPDIDKAKGSVIIWRMRGLDDAHSTFLKWLRSFADRLHQSGNRFILEGVQSHVIDQLKRSGLLDIIGQENVYHAEPGIFHALEAAMKDAQDWIVKQQEE